jgi:hypothetical protein
LDRLRGLGPLPASVLPLGVATIRLPPSSVNTRDWFIRDVAIGIEVDTAAALGDDAEVEHIGWIDRIGIVLEAHQADLDLTLRRQNDNISVRLRALLKPSRKSPLTVVFGRQAAMTRRRADSRESWRY